MDKNCRIAIIGAGPAGITAAYYLEKNGFTNYEILEREDHVGGKCFSPYYKGKRYDMGAILGAPSYDVVQEMMRDCGIQIDGDRIYAEMRDYLSGELTSLAPSESRMILREIRTLKNLLSEKYQGYDEIGHLNTNPDLMVTFSDFCKKNDLNNIEKVFINPFTSFGYGYLDEIPAIYVLKYLDMATLNYFLKEELWSFNDGTQSLWERISYNLKNQPILNVKIENIQRENNIVTIKTNLFTREYDYLIVTSPLDHLYKFMDLTSVENDLFSKIETIDYKVFAVTLKKYPKKTCYIQGNMYRRRLGHTMIYFVKWPKNEEQVVTLYAIGDKNLKTSEITKMLYDDMELCGYPINNIILEKDWYYFPHINTANYLNGWYKDVEAIQGKMNTFYAGEVLSFGDMEETSAYSKNIVDKYFK